MIAMKKVINPKEALPTSPINILAGGKLKIRKPAKLEMRIRQNS